VCDFTLKNDVSVEINMDNLYGKVFIDNVEVLEQKCSNTIIRKALGVFSCSKILLVFLIW